VRRRGTGGLSGERYSAGNSRRRVSVEDKAIINAQGRESACAVQYKWAWESTSPPAQ